MVVNGTNLPCLAQLCGLLRKITYCCRASSHGLISGSADAKMLAALTEDFPCSVLCAPPDVFLGDDAATGCGRGCCRWTTPRTARRWQSLAEILAALDGISPRRARIPMISAMTGEFLDGPDAGPRYWYEASAPRWSSSARWRSWRGRAPGVHRGFPASGLTVGITATLDEGADAGRDGGDGDAAPRRRRPRAAPGLPGQGVRGRRPVRWDRCCPARSARNCRPIPSSTSATGHSPHRPPGGTCRAAGVGARRSPAARRVRGAAAGDGCTGRLRYGTSRG